jgi:hypothetical protein
MQGVLRESLISAMFAFVLISCSGANEQAIRHLVTAELIEREQLPESHIDIRSIRFVPEHKAEVMAKMLERGGRSGAWRTLRCDVERIAGRWAVRQVSRE